VTWQSGSRAAGARREPSARASILDWLCGRIWTLFKRVLAKKYLWCSLGGADRKVGRYLRR
jgi:hypothetical protein